MLDEFDVSRHFGQREEARLDPKCYEIMNKNLGIDPREFDVDHIKGQLKKELFNKINKIVDRVKQTEDKVGEEVENGYAYYPLYIKSNGKMIPMILRDFCSGRVNDDNIAYAITTGENVLTSNYFTNMTKDKYQNKQVTKYPGTIERKNLSQDIVVDLDSVLEFDLDESVVTEEYPTNFSMEEFKSIHSYNGRLKYAAERLKRIGSGSSRIVFDIDGEKVLKVARNAKGLEQNEQEISLGQDNYFKSILAQVYDFHPDSQWVEMQKAEKVNKGKFKALTGIDDINKLSTYLKNQQDVNNGRKPSFSLSKEETEFMHNNEFAQSIMELMLNYDLLPGDLGVLTSYGVVKKDGQDDIVLIDYGITNDMFNRLYNKKSKARFFQEVRMIIRNEVKKLL